MTLEEKTPDKEPSGGIFCQQNFPHGPQVDIGLLLQYLETLEYIVIFS